MRMQITPPQKPLVSKTPSDDVTGTSSRIAVIDSPSPISVRFAAIPAGIFSTASAGILPSNFIAPARSIGPATNRCATIPAIQTNFADDATVQAPFPDSPILPACAGARRSKVDLGTHRR